MDHHESWSIQWSIHRQFFIVIDCQAHLSQCDSETKRKVRKLSLLFGAYGSRIPMPKLSSWFKITRLTTHRNFNVQNRILLIFQGRIFVNRHSGSEKQGFYFKRNDTLYYYLFDTCLWESDILYETLMWQNWSRPQRHREYRPSFDIYSIWQHALLHPNLLLLTQRLERGITCMPLKPLNPLENFWNYFYINGK